MTTRTGTLAPGLEYGRFPRLPVGPHGIPPEVVRRNQRERLIAAITEVCAERGYTGASVAAITSRAGVSRATFYELFSCRLDCMMAAYEELWRRLIEEIRRATRAADHWDAKVATAISTALRLLSRDPAAARLLVIEILAAGPEAAQRHYAMIGELANRLGKARGESGVTLSQNTEWGIVAYMTLVIARQIVEGRADRLTDLEPDFLQMVLTPSLDVAAVPA